jgi:hypothetical protein
MKEVLPSGSENAAAWLRDKEHEILGPMLFLTKKWR